MQKKKVFMQRKKGAGDGAAEAGARRKRVRGPTRRARGNAPQHIMACQGAAVKGSMPPGGILGFPRRGVGRGIPMRGKGARDGALDARGAY